MDFNNYSDIGYFFEPDTGSLRIFEEKLGVLRHYFGSDAGISGNTGVFADAVSEKRQRKTGMNMWNKEEQLKKTEGSMDAVPDRGCRVLGYSDSIKAEAVECFLKTKWAGRSLHYLREVNSTNQFIKTLAEEGAPEGTLVTADIQTQGKGRIGRIWTTAPNANIAMSLLLRPGTAPDRISMVTLVMGLAVAKACRKLYDLPAGIKWPNDVVVNGKKLCGILTEMQVEGTAVKYVVIGTGINVNTREFPEEIRQTATSLLLELGKENSRAELMAECMNYFEMYYEKYLQTEDLSLLQEEYNELLLNRNRGVRVLEPGNEYAGVALGINKEGELLVEKEDGTKTAVYAGEVSVRGVYGYV